ncbi:hypothetical protein [Paracraurococcus lichenis]|uniref:Uncharacterized protein n=1 Tax=Paracraurococcus lichenis TaxID=3064888 RepID=A0ABT9ECN3_9PROT|nr:hypothetical protein [Paracraurococcus sp. LOR1-02]MDO9713795.1 hypothetical protein [Paracraurococcus sp. LOR1-02]
MSVAYPGAVLLREFPGDLVLVECRRCPRRGRYRLATLLQRFGPTATLPEVLVALSADCDRRRDWRHDGPCGAGFPDLVRTNR